MHAAPQLQMGKKATTTRQTIKLLRGNTVTFNDLRMTFEKSKSYLNGAWRSHH
jgi:hypothetical protein